MKPVIGITIATPGYFDLATEAAARFRHYGDTEVVILTSNESDGYDQKFNILNIVGDRTAVFFDSDWWAVRHFDISKFYNTSLVWAVKDASRHALESFCLPDALHLGFPAENYVNTGLFVVNGREQRHHHAFQMAQDMMKKRSTGQMGGLSDRTEQSILNYAWHLEGVTMEYLPDEWNYWPRAAARGFYQSIPSRPVAIHAADVELRNKEAFLQRYCAFYESDAWKTMAPSLPGQIELAK